MMNYFTLIYTKSIKDKLNPDISLRFIASGTEKSGGCETVKNSSETVKSEWKQYDLSLLLIGIRKIIHQYTCCSFRGKTKYSIENYVYDPIFVLAAILDGRNI